MRLGPIASQSVRVFIPVAGCLVLVGCQTDQSVLHPAAEQPAAVARLFWAMTLGGAVIWLVVFGTAVYAVLGKRKPTSERFADRFILVGGVIFPTLVLAVLLVFGLRLLPGWRQGEPDLRIHIVGEQYWWRISYELPDGTRAETATELHLPKGRVVEMVLTAHDVIHSFWVPALGGKLDVIPGRTNRMQISPAETGNFRGVCAEYCGLSHALMALEVTVHEPEQFAAWLASEALPATADISEMAGAEVFLSAGCGACHQIRGFSQAGGVGPDLTHLARRDTIAGGTLPLARETLARWIANPEALKPDARMPSFASLADHEREQLLDFLMALK